MTGDVSQRSIGMSTVAVPAPVFAYPGPDDTPAQTLVDAAWKLRHNYDTGGSNVREGIAALLDNVAHVLDPTATTTYDESRPAEHPRAWWDGPVSSVAALTREPQGTVAMDDVGTLRQLRYGNSHAPGGWTAHGNSPLTTRELVEDGQRPVWLLRIIRDAS